MHKWSRVWVLYGKEWMRLKRNPAALMAVGLIILMAFLVNIENKASKRAKKQENASCAVVFNQSDLFIDFLKTKKEAQSLQWVKIQQDLNGDIRPDYPPSIRCAIEIANEAHTDGAKTRKITFRAVDKNNVKINHASRWVLATYAEFEGKVTINHSLQPMQDKAPTKTLGTIDLGSNSAKGMVGAMLIFSAQYFLCCALFISFTAYERERGILQSLSLTVASPGEILFAKILFHLSLSAVASLLIISILTSLNLWWFPFNLVVLLIVLLSSIGFLAIATIITSLNRTQTAASLVGFCYLMLMGVIFALAPKFVAFGWIKAFMFEGHAIALFNNLLTAGALDGARNQIQTLSHMLDLLLLPTIMLAISFWLWQKFGWKTPS